ncbi:fumarylacetoacetate hydrolase family protein [Vibrio maritimus]|uniref:fumarylacetoacetate hydrolase family protein n=1 Tax=Vibrio maritimus TaxID=990268 RepID=UPI00406770B6
MRALLIFVLLPLNVLAAQFGRIEYEGSQHWIKVAEENQKLYDILSDAPFDNPKTLETIKASEAKLIAPLTSGSVYAVGLNFRSHAGNSGAAKPEIFFKSVDSVRVSGDLSFPKGASNVHFEGELVIVIGKECQEVSKSSALECVFGYLAGNDLTERSWQGQDLQWWRAKGARGFGPVSSFIVSDIAIKDQVITTTLNGKIMQQESVANMIHDVPAIVSYISTYITLHPGDLIFAGTPGRTRSLKTGDVVSVAIDGIGEVTNTIQGSN